MKEIREELAKDMSEIDEHGNTRDQQVANLLLYAYRIDI